MNEHLLLNNFNKQKKYHFLLLFALTNILIYGFFKDFYFFLFLLIVLIYVYKKHIPYKIILIYFHIALIIVLIKFFINDFIFFDFLNLSLDKIFNINLRKRIIDGILNFYDEYGSAMISLTIFNIKNNNISWEIYQNINNMSITYLIVIGGFQISFINIVIKKIIKNKKYSYYFSLLITIIFSYFLNFSPSIMRVLMCLILTKIFKNIKNKYDIVSLSGLLIIISGPECMFNYGFCMSYACSLIIIYISEQQINNYFIEKILIDIVTVLITLPFVALMNKNISLWTIFFSFAFSYFFIFLFFLYLFTFWIVWFPFLLNGVSYIVYSTLSNIQNINIKIPLFISTNLFMIIYYYIYFICIILYERIKK